MAMHKDEIDRLINPPLIGIHEDNLKPQGLQALHPGMLAYAWPRFPFPILKPWQRTIAAIIPRKYRWVLYWAILEHARGR